MITLRCPPSLLALVLVVAPIGAAYAQEELTFSPAPVEACLLSAEDLPAMEQCVGRSAEQCMDSNDMGYTTVGMGFCFDRELGYWDARLNAAYGKVRAKDKAVDAELADLGSSAPSLADSLRDAQRAWIPWRDAACDYERAQWQGGTGGGPATLSCLMYMTARRALELEINLAFGDN